MGEKCLNVEFPDIVLSKRNLFWKVTWSGHFIILFRIKMPLPYLLAVVDFVMNLEDSHGYAGRYSHSHCKGRRSKFFLVSFFVARTKL